MEDHTSMANNALIQLLDNMAIVEQVLAVEMLISAQAISIVNRKMKNLKLGQGSQKLYDYIRRHTKETDEDKFFRRDILKMIDIMNSKEIETYLIEGQLRLKRHLFFLSVLLQSDGWAMLWRLIIKALHKFAISN